MAAAAAAAGGGLAQAESSIPPVSGVLALEEFALKEHWKYTSSRGEPYLVLQHLTYVRGPMETVNFLELSGESALQLNLQTGEEALLVAVAIRCALARKTSAHILVATRSVPDERTAECEEVARVVACQQQPAGARPSKEVYHAAQPAVQSWHCKSKFAIGKGNQP